MLRAVSGSISPGAPGVLSLLFKTAIPFIAAPTGTMANNGAITLGTALPVTYPNCYLYLPASAISAGSLVGWYFAQMSSATVGTVFNNTYAGPGSPVVPAAPTAFVTTGPGAYTGVTTAVTGPNISLPGNTLGVNGSIVIRHMWQMPNNADNKVLQILLGATSIFNSTVTTSSNFRGETIVQNQGSLAAQVCDVGGSFGAGASAGADQYLTVNTAAAQLIAAQMTLATATDFIILDSFMVEIAP